MNTLGITESFSLIAKVNQGDNMKKRCDKKSATLGQKYYIFVNFGP